MGSCWLRAAWSTLAVPWVTPASSCPPPSPTRCSPRLSCGATPASTPLTCTCSPRSLMRRLPDPTSVPCHQADHPLHGAVRLPGSARRRPLQARPLPLLGCVGGISAFATLGSQGKLKRITSPSLALGCYVFFYF